MEYIKNILSNIFDLAVIIFFMQALLTWFILFPLFGIELWIEEKKENREKMRPSDWELYNKLAKDDPTITPEQWRKYAYAYNIWQLTTQRKIPFWTWYERKKKNDRFTVKDWEYKRIRTIL